MIDVVYLVASKFKNFLRSLPFEGGGIDYLQ